MDSMLPPNIKVITTDLTAVIPEIITKIFVIGFGVDQEYKTGKPTGNARLDSAVSQIAFLGGKNISVGIGVKNTLLTAVSESDCDVIYLVDFDFETVKEIASIIKSQNKILILDFCTEMEELFDQMMGLCAGGRVFVFREAYINQSGVPVPGGVLECVTLSQPLSKSPWYMPAGFHRGKM